MCGVYLDHHWLPFDSQFNYNMSTLNCPLWFATHLVRRAGKMSLPSNGLILVHKLRKNLLPGDGDNNACEQKEYVTKTKREVQYWAPVDVSGLRKSHFTCLQEQYIDVRRR
jgi:hypothetical protein